MNLIIHANKNKILLIFLVSTMLSGIGRAQTKTDTHTITGQITGKDNNHPLEAVRVTLLHQQLTTYTDSNGRFLLKWNAVQDSLWIHALGYTDKTMAVTGNTTFPLVIALSKNVKQLNEVIVSTGYQRIPKERATGSFEQIDNEMLNRRVSGNIISRLEGVSSILFNRLPQRPPLMIRGLSTINGAKDPLIVVDNFPYNGDINNIDPNDVESVTILKDATAASIWGTRAGNGVIVITTKHGQFNKPMKIDFNANITISGKPDLHYLKWMSPSDYIQVEKLLFDNGYYYNSEISKSHPSLSPAVELFIAKRDGTMTKSEVEKKFNLLRQHNVIDDFDKYIYRKGIRRQYALNVSGGSGKINYYLSGGMDRGIGVLDNHSRRINFRSRNIFRPVRNLTVRAGITYTQNKNTSGKPDFTGINTLYPYSRLADDQGNPIPLSVRYRESYIDTAGEGKLLDWHYYPLDDYRHDTRTTISHDILADIGLSYRLWKGLSLDAKYQFEQQQTQREHLSDLQSYNTRNLINSFSQLDRNTGKVDYAVPKGAILDYDRDVMQAHSLRAQFNYDYNANKSNISAIAGLEIRSMEESGYSNRYYGYDDNTLVTADVDYVNRHPTFTTGGTAYISNVDGLSGTEHRFVSFYTNAAYTYDNRYTVSASARRDASNLFGVKTNDKWTPLWSAGAAWIISNEQFFNSPLLPFLKLRATYGFSGNAPLNRSAVTIIKYFGSDPNTNLPSATIVGYKNPALRWEKIGMLNLGIDFRLDGRVLTGSLDYYHKNGKDLFGPTPYDYTTGLHTQDLIKNVASMSGNGLDLSLNARVINQTFGWQLGFLLNYSTDKVTDYYQTTYRGSDYLSEEIVNPLEGKPVYSVLSYRWGGLNAEGDPQGFINGKLNTDYRAITTDGTMVDDLVYNGPGLPLFHGSLVNTFSWKGLTLSACLTYELGAYFRRPSIDYYSLFTTGIQNTDFEKRWQKPGDEKKTYVPAMKYPADYSRAAFYRKAEVLVDKTDFIRLLYVNLEYSLHKKPWKKSPFTDIKLYAHVSNLGLLWKANKDRIDPDYYQYFSMPPSTELTLGIDASF